MWNPFWKPKGRRVTRLEDLRDGMSVQAILFRGSSYSIKVRDAEIRISARYTMFDNAIYLQTATEKYTLGYIRHDGTYDMEHIYLDKHYVYTSNKFIRRPTMANKLLSALNLNKEQRKLSKAGVYDENGRLTADGQEFLLNFLAKKNEAELVELTKDFVKDKKCKDKDD